MKPEQKYAKLPSEQIKNPSLHDKFAKVMQYIGRASRSQESRDSLDQKKNHSPCAPWRSARSRRCRRCWPRRAAWSSPRSPAAQKKARDVYAVLATNNLHSSIYPVWYYSLSSAKLCSRRFARPMCAGLSTSALSSTFSGLERVISEQIYIVYVIADSASEG